MPFNVGPVELLLVLAILLLVIGPGKLPEMGSAIGRTIREFRKASTDIQEAASLTPTQPATPATQAAAEAPLGTPAEPADDRT